MGKTLVMNLENINLKGDILDVGENNLGVIYNLSKEIQEELSLDYVSDNNIEKLRERKYDACTFFFELNKIWTVLGRQKIISEITNYLKDDGEVFIWDINKGRGKVFNNKIKVILPKGNVKEFTMKNVNVVSDSNIEEIKKIVEKNFEVEEVKSWQDVFFIRAKKINKQIK